MLSAGRSGLSICRCSIAILNRNWALLETVRHRREFSLDVSVIINDVNVGDAPREKSNAPTLSAVSAGIPKISSLAAKKKVLTPQESSTLSQIPHWVQTPIDLQLFKANSVDELWTVVAKYKLSASQVSSFLVSLVKLSGANCGNVIPSLNADQKRYLADAKNSLTTDCVGLPGGDTLIALRSLLQLGDSTSDPVVQKLQHAVSRVFHLLGMSNLISFVCFHARFADSSEVSKTFQNAMEEWLYLHIDDSQNPNDLMSLMVSVKRGADWTKKLEMKLLEHVSSMTGEQVSRLLNVLAVRRSRSIPLLKAVANRYRHCEDDFSSKRLVRMLSDVCLLNFYDLNMLNVLCRDLQMKLDTTSKPGLICSIFSSLAIMRLRPLDLLESLCRWSREHSDAFSLNELTTVVVALARCNYVPEKIDGKDLLAAISDRVSADKMEKQLYLDCVWSLMILNHLSAKHANAVLNQQFIESVLPKDNQFKCMTSKMKLLNVNTAARYELNSYKGNLLSENAVPLTEQVNLVRYKQEVLGLLTDALNQLAPNEKYMKTNYICPEGYVIDAVIYLDADKKPVPVTHWNIKNNCRRTAFVLRHFKDKTFMSDAVVGVHEATLRHLKRLGYFVIEVPEEELHQRRHQLARLQFLKEKLNSICPPSSPASEDSLRKISKR